MEYALRLAMPQPLPEDARRWCPEQWRALLPEGPLQALYFGSEFCQDLLPSLAEGEEFCALAEAAGLEAVLLTPVVRADGLDRIQALVGGLLTGGWTPTLVCNDFGVLLRQQRDFPGLKVQAGRLLNRALRDPRLAEQERAPQEQRSLRGEQLRALLQRQGVSAIETDPDLEGSYLGDSSHGLQRVLHLPYVFAASGRNCLYKAETLQQRGNFAKGFASGCAASCRGRVEPVVRDDLGLPLWRSGNTLFYEATAEMVSGHLARADRVVLHEGPCP